MGGGSKTQKTVNEPSKLAKPYLEDILKRGSANSQVEKTFFPGQTFAGFDPSQIAGQDALLGFAQGGAQDLYNNTYGAYNNILAQADPNSQATQGLVNAAIDPVQQRLQMDVLPGLRNRGVASGNFGGIRQELGEQQALGQFGREAGNVAAGVIGQGQNRALQALGQAQSIGQLGMLPGQIQQGVGAQRQQQAQAGITEDIARYNFEQTEADQRLGGFANLVGGLPLGSTSTQTGKSGGGLGQGLLGAAMLASNFIAPGVGPAVVGGIGAATGAFGAGGAGAGFGGAAGGLSGAAINAFPQRYRAF